MLWITQLAARLHSAAELRLAIGHLLHQNNCSPHFIVWYCVAQVQKTIQARILIFKTPIQLTNCSWFSLFSSSCDVAKVIKIHFWYVKYSIRNDLFGTSSGKPWNLTLSISKSINQTLYISYMNTISSSNILLLTASIGSYFNKLCSTFLKLHLIICNSYE